MSSSRCVVPALNPESCDEYAAVRAVLLFVVVVVSWPEIFDSILPLTDLLMTSASQSISVA